MIIREASEKDIDKIMKIFIEEYKKPPYNKGWTEEYARKKGIKIIIKKEMGHFEDAEKKSLKSWSS